MFVGTLRPVLSVIVALSLIGGAQAVQPTLSAIDPPGVQRGGEAELTFRGARLEDAQELMFYQPGIEVANLEVVNGSTVKASLKVAADCELGFHAVRLRTETGISDLRLFSVGALKQVAEVEPNSDFASPQPIELDTTVYGVVENEDVDYYVVEAKKGERITAELEGLRLGNAFFDPYLAILNAKRFELARSDDAPLLGQDCLCSIIAPEDGKYIIQVRESAYGGDGNSKYRLHVGRFPRPRAVLPAGGRPGETLEVTWIGDAAGERKEQIAIPADAPENWQLFARDEQGIAPSGNGIRVNDLVNTIEAEPNNSIAEATPANAPGALHGVIGSPGDVDFFKFAANKGEQFDVRVFARNVLRSPLDSVLTIRNAQGGAVVSNDDSGGPDSFVQFDVPADGEYFLEIRDHLGAGGADYAYRVEIVPRGPRLTMNLPERERYVATTLSVPQGNRMALMVNARRENFGGDLNVHFEGLPPGMTYQTIPMPAGSSDVPVLFTAAADAPAAGALADLQGRPTDENLKIVGHLAQRTMLVRGQNNTDVYGHDADRMAAAVTKEAPFALEVVQPQAPLVRNGSMQLKVVATRSEGFDAPINIALLYNPPGIGSSGSVNIPQGQNEAAIPLTANGGAAIGTWKIVVVGSAAVGNGRVEVASQMADLEIAEMFFNLAVGKAAVEQGQQTQLVVQIETKRPFDGAAQIQLLGLPNGAAAEPMEFDKDATEVVFSITTEKDARVGRHQSVLCRAVATVSGEPVTHTVGTGELRVDAPLPPKVAASPPSNAEAKPEEPKPPADAPKKPLSRLEQLRLAKEQQEQ